MANVSLNQFVCLKQPASDYLSQCYQISAHIKTIIEELEAFSSIQFNGLLKALKMLLESFQIGVHEAHCALDDKDNPYFSFLPLHVLQTQGINLLREAILELNRLKNILIEGANALATYKGFDHYRQEYLKAHPKN